MSKLRRGRYIGNRKDLYGETVLIEKVVKGATTLHVQFDDLSKFDHHTKERLALSWHEFPKTDFIIFDDEPEIPLLLRLVPIVFMVAWLGIAFGVTTLFRSVFG